MRLHSRLVVVPAVLALGVLVPTGVGAAAEPAAAPAGTYTAVDVPGADATRVAGINNWGAIAGSYDDAAGGHGFIRIAGSVTTVDVPGTDHTTLTAINDIGTVVGTYWDSSGTTQHAFVRYAWGTVVPLDYPGLTGGELRGTVATGVNDLGTVVGFFFTTDRPGTPDEETVLHGFVWRNGQFTVYDALASGPSGGAAPGTTRLLGMDNAGRMVGDAGFRTPGVPPDQGFVVFRSAFTTIVDPTVPTNFCGHTEPAAVNDRGTVVGNSGNGCTNEAHPAPTFNAWLLDGAQFTYLAYPGAARTVVNGLNDWGTAVGTWTDATGTEHGCVVATH